MGRITKIIFFGLTFLLMLASHIFNPNSVVRGQSPSDWYMAGSNPQRTSWVPSTAENQTEIRGVLSPEWYRPIEPYINYKFQIIASNDLLYISTAKGLYVLHTGDNPDYPNAGELAWVYPTDLPLGHSPTVVNGFVYVGGYDKKIHAIDATPDIDSLPSDPTTGYKINNQVTWIFDAQDNNNELAAGFETNPLVVNNTVYAGNRDGYMYAINATTGDLNWRYQTDGPILFSAAYDPSASAGQGAIYFASNDAHAYALNASNGNLIWKSDKLPGAGFHSWWPVVTTQTDPATGHTKDYVIFGGSENYTEEGSSMGIGIQNSKYINQIERSDLYYDFIFPDQYDELIGPIGNESGNWVAGTVTIDASRTTQYLEDNPGLNDPAEGHWYKPWRRTYFVIDAETGVEAMFDTDNDGHREYAPIAWFWTGSGNRYPALVGNDNVLYQANNYNARDRISHSTVSGWKFGTQYISKIASAWGGVDEPEGYSSGGNVLYRFHNGDVELKAIDISIPYGEANREWSYYNFNLDTLCPGYDVLYTNKTYKSGTYAWHGNRTGPTPYKGKVYIMAKNSIIAWSDTSSPARSSLSMISIVEGQLEHESISQLTLQSELENEISKMIAAGHLRPGYHHSGLSDLPLGQAESNYLTHYFNNPAETWITLSNALPYISAEMQTQTKQYLTQEFATHQNNVHIGWNTGAPREDFQTPPEIQEKMMTRTPNPYYPPKSFYLDQIYSIYGLWKYSLTGLADVSDLYSMAQSKLIEPGDTNRSGLPIYPTDSDFIQKPFIANAYIAGYWAFLELEVIANQPESNHVRTELDRLLDLRVNNFIVDFNYDWHYPLETAANYMFLTPELGNYLAEHANTDVLESLNHAKETTPYWFVSKYDATKGEGTLQHLYEVPAVFQAKAWILKESRSELIKFLDVPAFPRGDLFYIQNLVAAIEADGSEPLPSQAPTVTPEPLNQPCTLKGDTNICDGIVNILDYSFLAANFGTNEAGADLNNDGDVNVLDYTILSAEFGNSL